MNRCEAAEINRRLSALENAGIEPHDAEALRRISMQLHSWFEGECGTSSGGIERDDATQKPFWCNSTTGTRRPIADREKGALKRLAAIMARYPKLRAYVQGDPRGCALYILRPDDAPKGEEDSNYPNGIAVY